MSQRKTIEAPDPILHLIEEVEQGNTITLTLDGKPVAELGPIQTTKRTIEDTIAEITEFRKQHPARGLKARDLVEEGRRI